MKFSIFLKKYSFLIGIVLFIIILLKSDSGRIFQNIKEINPFYLILAGLLTLPTIFIKSSIWNYIKKQQKINYGLKDSFLMYCSGVFIGLLTPGRIGEIAKALYLKKDGYSMGRSLVATIIDRVSDFVFILLFLFIGSLFLLTVFKRQILIFILGIIILIVLFLMGLKSGLIKLIIKKIFYIFIPQKKQKSWKINFQDFIEDIKIYNFKKCLIILAVTTLSWVFYYLQMYILARSLDINVSFLCLSLPVTVAGLITLIPVSISGIGTRDAALITLLAPFSVAPEKAIVFSALILLMILFAAVIGLICWIIKPLRI